MVTNEASIKRNGVQDYVSLRATALIILAYSLFMAWFFITTDSITYTVWSELFSGLAMKVFTLAALVAVMIHVRIGLWQVLTDYVKAAGLRAVLQYVLNIIAFGYVAVGLFVLWGV
ncbi:succinate dehydrogenase, hydrophobic membrane anchor protein [Alteromonas sp. KUL49]|uniref:succinate dehydrogenase, hydrophobic membrane anchor protein n=1 Tax=Alteromonas sp. KUL49 TaxID=2480798 RepID=UPI00102EFC17|nr:succinate dehydrogenase, hydrophobic membrane anchor protein [Alteromonas sp. KUL49]TAP35895.1 succinate dehydrogenase, hydrophobic membrane anchor protein [Alteromonas sp. KUL49]GEA13280.1 succinate dehydrogenase hydrophobic membrane anchor subunit [Alteromonas sp. KUL49]